ncbi:LysM peptidoglycan-binding domain-containing protein [Bacillus tianshenii]|nr:LysM peptidoglycan-binding domain-containing protein [Bacillus tianshenii]
MPKASGTFFIYTVQSGDTLYSIAKRLGSSVKQIEQQNSLYPPFTDPSLIFPGQVLVVSNQQQSTDQVFYIVNAGDHLYSISTRFSSTVEQMLQLNPEISDPNVIYINQMLRVPAQVHIVSAGDSLYDIARKYNVALEALIKANNARASFSPDVIYPGYAVIIPRA